MDKYLVKKDLKNLVDEEYKRFHSNLCPGTNNILGVRVPVLRNYAKELNQKYDISTLMNIIEDEYYEETMLKGMIIGINRNLSFSDIERYIREFVPKIDNWAICDVFCAGLKITNKYKTEIFSLVKEYLKSNKEFEVRFGIVMILDYYIEEEYLREDFKLLNEVKLDKYYVKMAIAWAISVCLIKFYDQTIEYLIKESNLDDWTYNKAIQKATESYRLVEKQKEELRKMKRK